LLCTIAAHGNETGNISLTEGSQMTPLSLARMSSLLILPWTEQEPCSTEIRR